MDEKEAQAIAEALQQAGLLNLKPRSLGSTLLAIAQVIRKASNAYRAKLDERANVM